jgi:hypothetical protein
VGLGRAHKDGAAPRQGQGRPAMSWPVPGLRPRRRV